jgi:predicted AAA+ superfamily ATPase
MTGRPFWLSRVRAAWARAPIAWLAGVRRVGKTTLAKALPDADFVNCDLPAVARELDDPEAFLRSVRSPILVLDEVHQLPDPGRILKIAADEFPKLKVLATGSSTLAATTKFRDALTGRKRTVHLVPVLPEECSAFGVDDLKWRVLAGGLPQALLGKERDLELYAEWSDSFFARDIHELFRIEKRQPFLRMFEWLLANNGRLVETTELSTVAGLSRPTVVRYLDAMEVTQAVTVLRPFHGGSAQELVKQPKVYAFDTGFVCYARGFGELRPDDAGQLLENLTLESLQACERVHQIHFWRTKQQREVDFVVPHGTRSVDAIECKWNADEFSPVNLVAFRQGHPAGDNWLVCGATTRARTRGFGELSVRVVNVRDFRREYDGIGWSAGSGA